MPAPQDNQNALKHGAYCRVSLGRMHPALEPIRRKVFRLRQAFEQALVVKHGSIEPLHAVHLHSAMCHETLAQIWERRVKAGYEDMTTEQLAIATDRISRERDRRDASLDKLGLKMAQAGSVWDLPPDSPLLTSQPADTPTHKAPDAAPEPQDGNGDKTP